MPMKTNLWIVITIVVGFLCFLLGYSVSSYTGMAQISSAPEASGYGAVTKKRAESSGYR